MIRLTQYSKAAGCGCKIAPSDLQKILKTEINFNDSNLLVGNSNNDDAAVYEIENGNCIISTTDFFMPIVDDAFDFGRIAACNAISDVYAMGGKPLMAIAILAWPTEKLGHELAQKVLDGARTVCNEARIALAGGHSVESQEPIFGLAVTGIAKKNNIKKNNSAQKNDLLYLTKPIGTGVLSTAMKRDLLVEEDYFELVKVMTSINFIGEKLGTLSYVNAMTDVTGFGLIGHLTEMLETTNYSAIIKNTKIPLIKNLENYTSKFIFPDNTTRNYNAYKEKVKWLGGTEFLNLCDPQTSGGLLISVNENNKIEFEKILEENRIEINCIGTITDRTEFMVEII